MFGENLDQIVKAIEKNYEADEIFFIDYRGITSIGRCGSRAYMHILTERIAENIR